MKLLKISFLALGLLSLGALILAFGPQQIPAGSADAPGSPPQTGAAQPGQALPLDGEGASLTQTDDQGQVVVMVTPLNLSNPGSALEFEVEMNTHSVELDMDLTTLTALATDTGQQVSAAAWEGSQGGHHVSGRLYFPLEANEVSILSGARTLTMTIAGVDAPERVFQWTLK